MRFILTMQKCVLNTDLILQYIPIFLILEFIIRSIVPQLGCFRLLWAFNYHGTGSVEKMKEADKREKGIV